MAKGTLPTQAELRREFDYDPITGALTWRVMFQQRSKHGGRAGTLTSERPRVMYHSHVYLVHRLIWCWMTGDWPSSRIDHKDRDPSNNCWDNLRLATASQNRANAKCRHDSVSGLKGVTRRGRKWRAHIGVDSKMVWLGTFDTPEEAQSAYMTAATARHGEFANDGAAQERGR